MLGQMVRRCPAATRCRGPRQSSLSILGESGSRHALLSNSTAKEGENQGSGEAGTPSGTKNPTATTLCQMNNHPDFRLQQAKAGVARNYSAKGTASNKGAPLKVQENPVRSNDGTYSSRAFAADRNRLRQARRKELKSMLWAQPPRIQSKKRPSPRNIQQTGLGIVPNENPVRSNDGTSSGALAADRLRMARRKAIEGMGKPLDATLVGQSAEAASTEALSNNSTGGRPAAGDVKEDGIVMSTCENPTRSSDGTSSGALAADRLRMARRRALESMKKPSTD